MNTATETTSAEAYTAIKPKLPSLQEKVLTAIKATGETGATMEEVYNAIPDAGYVLHQRASELNKAGKIKVNGVRRNSKGVNQKVWIAA